MRADKKTAIKNHVNVRFREIDWSVTTGPGASAVPNRHLLPPAMNRGRGLCLMLIRISAPVADRGIALRCHWPICPVTAEHQNRPVGDG